MKNTKSLIIASFVFTLLTLPSMSKADVTGQWLGNKLNINGKACQKTSIEIKRTESVLSITASLDKDGSPSITCGGYPYTYYMDLIEYYDIKGNELWKDGVLMGDISDDHINAKGSFCDERTCKYFDYIKVKEINKNNISLWIDFDGAVLTGNLPRN